MNPINTCLFNSVNDNKNTINKSDKIFEKNKSNKHSFNSYKPFQTYPPDGGRWRKRRVCHF